MKLNNIFYLLVLAFEAFLAGFFIGAAAALLSFSTCERGGRPLARFLGAFEAVEAEVDGKSTSSGSNSSSSSSCKIGTFLSELTIKINDSLNQ